MKKNLKVMNFDHKRILGFEDIMLYSAILIFSYFSFQHGDILHTGGSSFTYLNGHITDFYEANVKPFGVNNYLPSTYIIFAIWNIPIKLLGLVTEPTFNVGYVVFWYKLLTTLFYFASAYIIYKIGLTVGLTKVNSKLMAAFWLSTPIAFFSQFIFGQYDILTTFFVLLGLLFYLKRNIKLFILFFAISMTFKYFPLFIFVPLLLMIEKKPLKLIIKMIFFFIPIGIEVLIYFHSKAFVDGVLGFSANGRVFTAGFKIDYGITISAFVVLWFLLCAFAYWKNIKDDQDFINWAMYLPMVVSSLLFSLMLWHPQWLLFATPFLAITTFLHKRANFFVLIDIVMMFFFVGFTVNFWTGNVDQSLWKLGVFGKHIVNDPNSVIAMKTFFIPHDISIYFSFISACFLINIIFKMPIWWKSDANHGNINDLVIIKHWNLIRSRFIIGVMIFIIPAVISILAPNNGEQIYNLNSDNLGKAEPIGEITKGFNVGQVFKANGKEIKMIKIQMATYSRINTSHLTFTLREYNPGRDERILFSKNIAANELNDSEYFTIKLKDISVLPEKYYSFNIVSNDAIIGNAATIWHTPESVQLENTFAILNGKKQNYNLHIMIYGKK
jgi:hypothetical protein